MKTTLLFLISLSLCTTSAVGQNKVTVKQQGSGNSVSISQSTKEDSGKDCEETMSAAKDDEANQILILEADAPADTIVSQSVLQKNIVDDHTELPNLSTIQKGSANVFLMQLTDLYDKVNTAQKGKNNYISARLDSSSHQVNLSQNGSNNSIAINPCSNIEK